MTAGRERFEQALALARKIGCPLQEARALEGVGRCARSDGQPEELEDAESSLRQAIALYEQLGLGPRTQQVQALLAATRRWLTGFPMPEPTAPLLPCEPARRINRRARRRFGDAPGVWRLLHEERCMQLPTPAPTEAATPSAAAPQRDAVLDRVAVRIQQRLSSEKAAAKPYGEAAHAASLVPEQ
ncbi:tetratricopeptide repeat protein [Streptomyces rochei]|uniref:tetratricopeptide repeat protein n=1 Tax=Streptomyces rochei TaxID=1928 RepID=UPI0036A1EA37